MKPSSSMALISAAERKVLGEDRKIRELVGGDDLPEVGHFSAARWRGGLLDGLLELAALDQVVGEPG